MKKLILLLAMVCSCGLNALASTSAMTATLTDRDGTVWANATYTATLQIPSSPGTVPTISGVPVSPLTVTGMANASGVISGTFTDTSSVDQANANWVFTIQPNASAPTASVSVAIIGATPNLTANFSSLTAPRFPAGATKYGYADVEVTNPTLGNTYFNTGTVCGITGGFRQYSNPGWQCGGGVPAQLSINRGTDYMAWGDSITLGLGATSTSYGYAQIVADWYNGYFVNVGTGSDESADMSLKVQNQWPFSNFGIIPNTTIMIGTNNVLTNGTTAAYITNYASQVQASLAQILIPNSDKLLAANATKSGFTTIPSGTGANVGASASTQNSTLTFSNLVTTVANEAVYFNWLGSDSNVGAFSISIDGSVVDNQTTQGPGGVPILTVNGATTSLFNTRYVVPAAGTHTFVVTMTSASGSVSPLWIGVNNPSHLINVKTPRVGVLDIEYEMGMTHTAAIDLYNAALHGVTAQLLNDGFSLVSIPTNKFLDNTLGMSNTNTVAPDGTFIPASTLAGVHPNDYGHRQIAQAVMTYLAPQTSLPSRGAKSRQTLITSSSVNANIGDSFQFTNNGGTITLPNLAATARQEIEIFNYDNSATKTVASTRFGLYSIPPNRSMKFIWDGSGWRADVMAGSSYTGWQFTVFARNTDITTTTLATPNNTASVFYEMRINVTCTAVAAGTVPLTITYTDSSSTVQTYTVTPDCTTLGSSSTANSVQMLRIKNNTNIQYATSHTGTQPTYDLGVILTQLTN